MTPEIKNRIDQIRHGEVPEGYLVTILGMAPEDWNKARIDEICTLLSGSTPRRDDAKNFAGNILWVTSGELKKRVICDTQEKISEAAVSNSNLKMYEPGTVVIAIYGLEADGIRGTASIIGTRCTISQACMAFTEFSQNLSNEYFYYWYLNSGQVIGLRYAQGTKQQNLSTEIVGAFPIRFPNIEEQQRIVEILTTQDRIIELKEKLITEKRRQKKYLMQQLLTGKKRLSGCTGKWEKVKAKTVFKNLVDKSHRGMLEVLSVTQDRGIIPRNQVDIEIKYDDAALPNYKLVQPGNFVISLRSFQGGIEYSKYKGIVSPAYTVLTNKLPIDESYYQYYFKSTNYIQRLQVAVYGIRDGKQIGFDAFGSIEIHYPPVKEQSEIAQIFIAADHEISLLQQSLEQEKQKKKALMQLLLTGIVRVNV